MARIQQISKWMLCLSLAMACLSVARADHHKSGGSNLKGVVIQLQGDQLRVEINGELFTAYNFRNVKRPYFYPVIGPGGVAMTRNWPMKEAEGEAKDHPHHKSFWYGHGDINGYDFWSEKDLTVHQKFTKIQSGAEVGVIQSQNQLVSNDGKVVATDERTVRIHNVPDARIVDFKITVHASHGDLVFGDTKEGSMALRLAPTMRLEGEVAQGHIVNSEGDRDRDTWGKRAKWVDYYGPVEGNPLGVAIFDHPDNPRHPTWWHVRPYGLFAANPFGIHNFEDKPDGTGDMKVPAGQSVTFNYRFYFHKGDAEEANVEEHYGEYAESADIE